jgi:hypothetical protein
MEFMKIVKENVKKLLGNKDVWKTGGSNSTGIYDSFGRWEAFSGKNLYSDFGYKSNSLALTDFTKF